MHIDNRDFALDDGLLPPNLAQGKVTEQFYILAEQAEISKQQVEKVFTNITSKENEVLKLIEASFLDEKAKRNYIQAYQTRLKKLTR